MFSSLVLDWFDQHGRKNLPWQKMVSPYRVWVSEIMLQQTQVKTVIPYFERFIQHFPTIEHLAKAKEDEVLTLWAGLGYYARARNLYKSAKLIQQEFNGKFPLDLPTLQKLPGIGRSTSGAILAIATGQKAPILDGNVKRVLTRFHGVKEWLGEPKTLKKLWDIAEQYTPVLRVADYTQAMMDLGATVCRKKPECVRCPLKEGCHAFKTQTTAIYPAQKVKQPLSCRSTTMIIFQQDNKILLKKRPSAGIWGGLWSFPESNMDQKDLLVRAAVIEKLYQDFGYRIEDFTLWPVMKHKFTHFQLDILPLVAKIKFNEASHFINEGNHYLWYCLGELEPAIPTPVKKILALMQRKTIL